jgi:hypothetical protein
MAFAGILKKVLAPFVIPWAEYNATAPTLSDGDQVPLQVGPGGGLAVEVTGGGGEHNDTTPTLADGDADLVQLDSRGAAHVNASLRHQRYLVLSATDEGALVEGACDAIRVNTDDVVVYGQPPERALQAVDGTFPDATNWTLGGGADWSVASNKATHATGNTNDLSQDSTVANPNDPLIAGETYVVVFTVVDRTAGTVTAKIGTGAGSARSTNATFVEAITAATDGTIKFTPTTDFDGAVSNVWVFPAAGPYKAGLEPEAFSHIVGVATAAAPATLLAAAGAKVTACWYRRSGATELG